jgi:opacity protein-like surface antigen
MDLRLLLHAAFTGSSALLLGLALPAADATEPQTWYVGGSTDSTHVEVYRGLGWEPGGGERGFSVIAGYQLNRRFSLELGALRATDLQWTEHLANITGGITAHTTFDTTALQASAVTTFHWGPTVEAFLKVGLAQYDVGGQQVLDTLQVRNASTRDVSASGSDYLLGGGIAIKATPQWRVRLEYQWFGLDRDFLGVRGGDDPSIDTLAIGVDYRLRRRTPTVSSLR